MRCPKCGYISFDHLDSCRKCHKPIADNGFKGASYLVVAPVFLMQSQEVHDSGFDEEMVEVLDPDLDLLADESDGGGRSAGEIVPGDEFEIAFGPDQGDESLALDEDDLGIDTSRFADVPINMQAVQATEPVPFVMPEGLADISDLAPPEVETAMKSDRETSFGSASLSDDDLNFDDLDLSFGGEDSGRKASETTGFEPDDDLETLSLDDIDLSGSLGPATAPASSRAAVDKDLDFDLDLGTLGETPGGARSKSSADLPEFHLSLD
jgi:hypothetical protein